MKTKLKSSIIAYHMAVGHRVAAAMVCALCAVGLSAFAEESVTINEVKSVQPWDKAKGTITVDYSLGGLDVAKEYKVAFDITANGVTKGVTNAAAKLTSGQQTVFTYDTVSLFGAETRAEDAKVKVSLIAIKPKPLPVGALPGEFSVSADKKVHFSQGNLVATINASGAPTDWKFAANQYDYIGNATANNSIGKSAGDVDLFGWSTDAASNNWGIHTKTSPTPDYTDGNFKDWGTAIDSKGTWRTLSKDEWTYLFNTRTASTVSGTENARYAKATVNDTTGVILLPDTYAHPAGVTDLTSINTKNAAFTVNTYDLTDWTKMESAGAVFLPAAGYRRDSEVSLVGSNGYYWSSTANVSNSNQAYRWYFNSNTVSPDPIGSFTGHSVRLVTEVK